ncbi:TAXI family TRAP transporter solute-binding subunit [Alkaliphilus serpentinus]|uniref:TAXI family TRAP transporter solute-binding subunit n=1 Tax=Alkaliphilus serpentinus TaxID=1482731 RepID=A0A833HQ52_9FIRM|nr:TAXI family TRAP transporter solute-binding subunit [Alkaliphilus serpentinus]KAB3531500.1 TAXI family TRAP transporter solute-binding subunit [Alkaliphilus serpentinus]
MNKRIFSLLLAVLLIAALVVGCSSTSNETTFISIATGGTSGTYYPLGGAFAKVFNDNVENVTANAQSTNASVENVGLLEKGEAELAFIQNDVTYYAYTGTEIWEGKEKVTNVRGMAMLYPEIVQIVALKDSGIESVEDLVGKKVAIGAPGSGAEANARQILAAHGISYDDLGKADYLSFAEAADQLKNKQMDAAFVTAGIPTSAITEVAQTADVVVIPISAEKIAELSSQYPFYAEVVIPAGTYKDQDSDITTAAVMAMLVVKADLDEDLVYELTKAIFENRQVIIDTHNRGNDITLDTALAGMPIEVHPGAQKYYDEKGVK